MAGAEAEELGAGVAVLPERLAREVGHEQEPARARRGRFGLGGQTLVAARLAKNSGAAVIGLVGAEGDVSAVCDVVLLLKTFDNTGVYTPTTSRIAALVVVGILSTAVALRRDEPHDDRLRRMKRQLNAVRSAEREDAQEPPTDGGD